MATTGTAVRDGLPIPQSVWIDKDDVTLAYINHAIEASWPSIKMTYYALGGTLSSNQPSYALTTLTPPPVASLGIARVEIVEGDNQPPLLCRGVRQYRDDALGGWVLVFAPSVTSAYNAHNFYVLYQAPHQPITSLTDTINLPLDYLVPFVAGMWAQQIIAVQGVDRSSYRELLPYWDRLYRDALRKHQTPALPTLTYVGKDRMV